MSIKWSLQSTPFIIMTPEPVVRKKHTFSELLQCHSEKMILFTALLCYYLPSQLQGLQGYSVTSIVKLLRLQTSLSLHDGCF